MKSLNYLRKGNSFGSKGVKILMDERKAKVNKRERAKQEFAQYQRQVKAVISQLINDGQLAQVKSLIAEYESIVKDDQEIANLKTMLDEKENQL